MIRAMILFLCLLFQLVPTQATVIWDLALNINPSDGNLAGWGNDNWKGVAHGTTKNALINDFVSSAKMGLSTNYVAIVRHQQGVCEAAKVFKLNVENKSLQWYFKDGPDRNLVSNEALYTFVTEDMSYGSTDPIFGANGALYFKFVYSNNACMVVIDNGKLSHANSNDDDTHGLGNDFGGSVWYHDASVLQGDCHGGSCKTQGTDHGSHLKSGVKYGDYALYVTSANDVIDNFPCTNQQKLRVSMHAVPYWLHRGTGRCPEENNFGHESSTHGTLQACRDKCEIKHESYFSLWTDGQTTKCGCYTDCDTLDTSVTGAESYEILSVTVRAELESNNQNLNTCTSAKDSCTENLVTKGNELTTCTTVKDSCTENLATKGNELTICTTAKSLCDTNLATKGNELTTCTTAKSLCDTNLATKGNELTEMTTDRGLWKNRFEEVQKLEDAIVHRSDIALEKFPEQQAVGVNCGQESTITSNTWFQSISKITFGAIFGAMVYAYFSNSSTKLAAESQSLL